MKKAFSLLELLIIISMIVLLASAFILLFNPKTQIDKANDGRRRAELSSLKKIFEDWYNDKGCYPLPPQVCYDAAYQRSKDVTFGTYVCHICGNQSASPSLSPYLSKLPCDPRQPVNKYLYQVDSLTCPSFYRVYTLLAVDPDPKEYCVYDEPLESSYNWGVSSSNTQPLIDCTGGNYYCRGVGDCSYFNRAVWDCVASFTDEDCTGSNNCAITSSCSLK